MKMYTTDKHRMRHAIHHQTHPVPNDSASPEAQHEHDRVPPEPNGRFLDCSLCGVLLRVSTVERW